MTGLDRLAELAKAATPSLANTDAHLAFRAACDPDAILALIERVWASEQNNVDYERECRHLEIRIRTLEEALRAYRSALQSGEPETDQLAEIARVALGQEAATSHNAGRKVPRA